MLSGKEEIEGILKEGRRIAVVGLSPKPERPSHRIASLMLENGYTVYPVNPAHEEILGLRAYTRLSEIDQPVDLAVIFRRPDQVMPVVEEAIALGIPAVWMQPGAENPAAAQKARKAGLKVVMNSCWAVEFRQRGL